jgi:signal transduction histidine kinase
MIIHDLRSPLTSIGLSMELLEKTGDSPSHRQRFISRSQKAINRTMSLVDQLTDVARLETNQLQINPRPLELDQLLHEKASHFASQIDATDKGIAVEIAFTLPTVFADLDLSSRVLDNLVSNAIKYTEPGGNILIRAEARGQEVVVQVSDDGPGINPEAKEKIFDKYFQVKDADGVPMRRGTGLGLTFCKLAIEAQSGRIWVESVPGEGSTFSFSLPIHN